MDALLRRRTMIAAGGVPPTPPPPPVPVGTQVEYLLTSDNQYFDTGIKAANDLDFYLDVELISSAGGACLFGARNILMSDTPNAATHTLSVFANANGKLAFNDISYDSGYLTSKAAILNGRHDVNVISRALYVDSTLYVTSPKATAYSYDVTVGLLRLHGLSDSWQTGSNRSVSAKIYGFKIYKSSVLVCELVPYKDENDVGFFYDTVTQGKFYNIGTGQVTPGPDINNI